MKQFAFLFAALILGGTPSMGAEDLSASARYYNHGYGNSFIFNVRGITFSVYPDGEFDFYIDRYAQAGVQANFGNVNISFNAGYNYDPFLQYDDYGAIVQVENVPIYYDWYGRVSQIGDVVIHYNNRVVVQVGGLFVHYNRYGVFSHCTGFINYHNPYYVYRPFYDCFRRPPVQYCYVAHRPYRRYYTPVRYTYYRPYRYNNRVRYYTRGRTYRGVASRNRSNIYRNDTRVVARRSVINSENGRRWNGTTEGRRSGERRSRNTEVERRSSSKAGRSGISNAQGSSNANRNALVAIEGRSPQIPGRAARVETRSATRATTDNRAQRSRARSQSQSSKKTSRSMASASRNSQRGSTSSVRQESRNSTKSSSRDGRTTNNRSSRGRN